VLRILHLDALNFLHSGRAWRRLTIIRLGGMRLQFEQAELEVQGQHVVDGVVEPAHGDAARPQRHVHGW